MEDDSDNDTEYCSRLLKTSEEQRVLECHVAQGFSPNNFLVKHNSDRASIQGTDVVGKPCISGEQLAFECPNWFNAGVADEA